jgi:hypothetical protein
MICVDMAQRCIRECDYRPTFFYQCLANVVDCNGHGVAYQADTLSEGFAKLIVDTCHKN